MPTLKVENLGRVGFVADKEPIAVPPEAWTDVSNVRCIDGSIGSFEGHEKIDTISVLPQTIENIKTGQRTYFVYADDDTIYSYSAGTETDISGYTYSTGGRWDSCVLGGVAILNNGVDVPQYWGGEGTAVKLDYDAVDDPDNPCKWDDVGMTAQLIRPFKYHLFAFDIDDCNGRNRRRVWWSHPAEPGSLPITWNITRADYDAGDAELSETTGYILDALQLRDTLQIYLDDAVYSVTYTGRQDRQIFNFRNVTTSIGIYARNCVCDIGGAHFLVSDGDIFLYDGNQFKTIADERVKDFFFNGINRSAYFRAFCEYYHRTGEVWLCYPSTDSATCDKALVWDKNTNTWGQRDIPSCLDATFGVVDRKSEYTWATLPYATWADWGNNPVPPTWTTWTMPLDSSPIYDSLVIAGDGALYEMDRTNQADGVNMTCYARRTALDIGDKADWHMALKLYPHAEGDAFRVRIGSQDYVTDSVAWSDYQAFDPNTDYKLDFRVSGRLHAIEFSSAADVSWKVSGYELDYEQVGRR